MKVVFQIFILIIFSIFLSCEKAVIPEPADPLVEEQTSLFYISGNFNGVEELKVVDSETYTAHTHSDTMNNGSGGTMGFWTFHILNTSLDTVPEVSIILYTENNSYEDLVSATDATNIEILNIPAIGNPGAGFFKHIEINLFEDNQFFSTSFVENSSLVINKSIDTIVDNKQYRILELEGNISLEEIEFNTPYQIDNFKARIAFSY